MEKVSSFITMTPEQRNKRKEEWKKRQQVFGEGKDPDKEKANERSFKALKLLKDHVNGTIKLNDVEKVALAGIVVERSMDDFHFFAKHVLDMNLLTDLTHKKWCDDHQKSIKLSKKRVMRLKPRGSYKTTVYGIATILWLWGCFSPQLRIFYTSANALLLQEVSDKLNQYIGSEKSETFFSTIFGITKDGTAKNTSDVINVKGRSGKGFSLVLRTAGGSSVGIHPNVIIVDDALDHNDRDSKTTRDGKEMWFDSLVPLLVPFKEEKTGIEFESVFYIGTRWHMKDLINHILERNETLPEKQRWDVEIESICDETGKSSYPDFISDEKIAEIRASISDVFFACQYQNNPLPDGMQIFDLKKLTFIREDQINLNLGQIACFFDPSLGKSHSDFPIVWWVHYHEDMITCYDCIDKKVELSLIVHQIAAKNQLYGCRTIVFESNGVTLIEQSLRDAHDRINWKMFYDPIHHSSNKHERIVSIQPDLYSGRVRFMSDYTMRYPEAMNQIAFYPVYGYDDAPDCLEMAVSHFRRKHFKFVRFEGCL